MRVALPATVFAMALSVHLRASPGGQNGDTRQLDLEHCSEDSGDVAAKVRSTFHVSRSGFVAVGTSATFSSCPPTPLRALGASSICLCPH